MARIARRPAATLKVRHRPSDNPGMSGNGGAAERPERLQLPNGAEVEVFYLNGPGADRGARMIADDLWRLDRAIMEEQVERFARALRADLILPEDF